MNLSSPSGSQYFTKGLVLEVLSCLISLEELNEFTHNSRILRNLLTFNPEQKSEVDLESSLKKFKLG